MTLTRIGGRQVKDSSVTDADLADSSVTRDKVAISPTGKALIRKILLGANNSLSATSSGSDSGTGDVTLSVREEFVKTTALVDRYRILTGVGADYESINVLTLEKIPFDQSIIEYDNAEHRYDTVNHHILIKSGEVWDVNISVLVDASGPFSIVLYNESDLTVVASSYCLNNNRGMMAHINTMVSVGTDSYFGVYLYASVLPTRVIINSNHGFSPCNLCSFKRIK